MELLLEAAFILSYSIIMLATDLHNPNVKSKMTKEQWLKNNTGCNKGADFDAMWMKRVYDRIAKAPLSTVQTTSNTAKAKVPLQKAASAQVCLFFVIYYYYCHLVFILKIVFLVYIHDAL